MKTETTVAEVASKNHIRSLRLNILLKRNKNNKTPSHFTSSATFFKRGGVTSTEPPTAPPFVLPQGKENDR